MCNDNGNEQCQKESSEEEIRASLRGTGYFKRKNSSRDRCNCYGFDFRHYFRAERAYYKKHVLLDSDSSCDSGEERIIGKVYLDCLEERLSGRTKEIFRMLRLYNQTYTAELLGIDRSTVYYYLQKIKEIAHGIDNA